MCMACIRRDDRGLPTCLDCGQDDKYTAFFSGNPIVKCLHCGCVMKLLDSRARPEEWIIRRMPSK